MSVAKSVKPMSVAKSFQPMSVAKTFQSMAMDRAGANAYLYAKVCGMLEKSFVGSRLSLLFGVESLSGLWSHVVKKAMPQLPEVLLARALEKEATAQFIKDYKTLLGVYENPPDVLIKLLHIYDYSNLKDAAAALCNGMRECPDLVNIAPYNILRYECWPDIKEMTAGGPLAWYDMVPEARLQHGLDERLDKQYTRELWESVCALPARQKEEFEPLIKEQIIFDNILWAIRLKIYFNMNRGDIIQRLAFATTAMSPTDPLAQDALHIVDWPVNSWNNWGQWKYRGMLNSPREGGAWRLDPRWTSRSFNLALQKNALRYLHHYPEAKGVLVCWFIIKRFEVNCVRTAVERLRLGAGRSDVQEIIGI